jgi:MSHA biogenesis protein MshO
MIRFKPANGFTLIELVIVITIAGIVAVLAATMIGNQMTAFVDLSRRAVLVDQAETAVRQMARDIRHALPNSVRVTGGVGADQYLELIPIKDAGRYRLLAGDGTVNDDDKVLDFSTSDTDFQVLGRLPALGADDRLVIYNIGQVDGSGDPVNGANVYAAAANNPASGAVPVLGSHVISDDGDTLSYTGTDSNVMTLNTGHQFAFQSPQKRFYLVDQALSYICDVSTETIWRYEGYDFEADQADDRLASPLSSASIQSRLLENVTECAFSYAAGNAQRSGLLTITLTVSEDGERIRLVHQVHVDNAP